MEQAVTHPSRAWLTRRHVLGLLPLALLGCAVPALAACGAAGGTGQQGGFSPDVVEQKVEVSAAPDGTLRWDRTAYSARAGDVTFVVRNPSAIPHRFGVEGPGVTADSPIIPAGKSGNYTLKGLRPGEYQIVCNYPGHRAAGMVAKLSVG